MGSAVLLGTLRDAGRVEIALRHSERLLAADKTKLVTS